MENCISYRELLKASPNIDWLQHLDSDFKSFRIRILNNIYWKTFLIKYFMVGSYLLFKRSTL